MLTYFVKRVHEIRKFQVADMQRWLRNIQKNSDAHAELLLCWYKPIAFFHFSLLSPASLLKLPIVVIQKFYYQGNTTSHFSSLLYLQLFFDIVTVSTHLHVICRHFILSYVAVSRPHHYSEFYPNRASLICYYFLLKLT